MEKKFGHDLLKGLKHRLESNDFRYTDNSYAYFGNDAEKARAEDQHWFASNKLPTYEQFIKQHNAAVAFQVKAKANLYSLLEDVHSKNTLLLVAMYSLLGHRFVRFPYREIHTPQNLASSHSLCLATHDGPLAEEVKNDTFEVGRPLYYYDLSPIGIHRRMFSDASFLCSLRFFEPYKYSSGNVTITIEPGDTVLDCGAFAGDTALFFSHKAGTDGHIYSFEPHPLAAVLFRQNVALNEDKVQQQIKLITEAVSNTTGDKLHFTLKGAGSTIRTGVFNQGRQIAVSTTTIDSEVKKQNISKVDFIKMDIEGAELLALEGAVQTIARNRPKLAICLYHQPIDFYTIADFINRLGLDYKFYLEHHFINQWETVLYATTR